MPASSSLCCGHACQTVDGRADDGGSAADPARRHIAEPQMIIEVLSPSTTLHDRGRKLDHYRQLPALKEILLVASEERRAQHWRRQGAR
jgi:Uma2 family endonuclease